MQWLWTSVFAAMAPMWKYMLKLKDRIHSTDERVSVLETTCEHLKEAAEGAREGRERIYDKIESARLETKADFETVTKLIIDRTAP